MQIEPATMGDLDTITDLWVELAADQRRYGSHLHAERNREVMRASIGQRIVDNGVIVARADETVVGFIMFEIESGSLVGSASRGMVNNVFVAAPYRGQGVGSALFEAAEARLEEANADVIALEVMAENEAARRFYRDLGYRPHRIEYERSLREPDDT